MGASVEPRRCGGVGRTARARSIFAARAGVYRGLSAAARPCTRVGGSRTFPRFEKPRATIPRHHLRCATTQLIVAVSAPVAVSITENNYPPTRTSPTWWSCNDDRRRRCLVLRFIVGGRGNMAPWRPRAFGRVTVVDVQLGIFVCV